MSRKSRYIIEDSVKNAGAKWRAGAYIRLSKEDGEAKDKDSQSVVTQKRIIDKFLSENPDVELFGYYIDDGYSGTTMDRPDFQRLKTDFENGTVNCIIVKDLSRFARNDDESGRYIYVIFPFYKIRFISVNDRVDSFAKPDSINNLEISFKNIMHSEYSRDLSKKVKTASNIRRRRGEFIGAFCSYGYKKDPSDIHRLIIDDEAAKIVQYIFRRYIETENIFKIAKELSAQNILTPLAYKKSKGCNIVLPHNQINPTVWGARTVKRILTNETYLGYLVQGTRQTVSYKNKRIVMKDKSQWIKVKNAHEPIVTQEEYDAVQSIMERKYKSRSENVNQNIFSGKIVCGNCGAAMTLNRSNAGKIEYYLCHIAYIDRAVCRPKRTRADKLERVVLDTLNTQLKLCFDSTVLLKKINTVLHKSVLKHSSVADGLQCELNRLNDNKNGLYEQYKTGILSREQYVGKKKEIEEDIAALRQSISDLNAEKPKELELRDFPIISELIKYRKFTKLTRDIVTAFIDKIVVFSPTEIEVRLSFGDEFERLQEYLADNSAQINSAKEAL